MTKIKKLAIIRDNDDVLCPFGLNINADCRVAGDAIDQMTVVPEQDADNQKQIEDIVNSNKEILYKNPAPAKCKYAVHLFKNKPKVVDCDYGDTAAGVGQNIGFVGSPYYTRTTDGLGMGGLLSYPLTYQSDGTEFRNLYYGLYGWSSVRSKRLMKRQKYLKELSYGKNKNM